MEAELANSQSAFEKLGERSLLCQMAVPAWKEDVRKWALNTIISDIVKAAELGEASPFNASEALPALLAGLDYADREMRCRSAEAFGLGGDSSAIERLIGKLMLEPDVICASAALALKQVSEGKWADMVPDMHGAFEIQAASIREGKCSDKYYGQKHMPAPDTENRKSLEFAEYEWQRASRWLDGLKKCHAQVLHGFLQNLGRSGDARVSRHLAVAYKYAQDLEREVGKYSDHYVDMWYGPLKTAALAALGELGNAAVAGLTPLLTDENDYVRGAAGIALEAIRNS